MDVPAAVASTLGDESVAARVPLRGDDALFVTPTRTLVYHADGLLSNESVEEFGHDAERVTVDDGRRKATVTLDYGLDGERSFAVPSGRVDDVLHPVLAGVLNAADVTDSGESVARTYHFSELTLVVTDRRLVRHVGAAVWNTDHDEIAYADVIDIDAEEGNVASQLVLETTGRTRRIKVPNEQFRDVRETVENALYEARGVPSYAAFRDLVAEEVEDAADDESDAIDASAAFEEAGIDAIGGSSAGETDGSEADDRDAADADASTVAADASADAVTDARLSDVGATDATTDADGATEAEATTDATATTEAEATDASRDDAMADADGVTDTETANTETTDASRDDAMTPGATNPVDASAETNAASTVPDHDSDGVDLAAIAADLEAARDALDDQRDRVEAQRDTIARQRRTLDAQLDALDEQRERIEDALDAIPDR